MSEVPLPEEVVAEEGLSHLGRERRGRFQYL